MARNKYSGICYRCGKLVETGEGHFELVKMESVNYWKTQHADCAIKYRGTKAAFDEIYSRTIMNSSSTS